VSAMLVDESDDILVVSRDGKAARFSAANDTLRPMGRSTAGVKGITLLEGDSVLNAMVVGDEGYVFVATDKGYAKKTHVSQYPSKGRGTQGVMTYKRGEHDRGALAGAIIVSETDEVLMIRASGKVIRSASSEVTPSGRGAMGVQFASISDADPILSIARNQEERIEEAVEDVVEPGVPAASLAAAGVSPDGPADAASTDDATIVDGSETTDAPDEGATEEA